LTGLIPAEELKKLQKRMNRLMEDLGLTDLESRYLEEMRRMQQRMGDLMEEVDTSKTESNSLTPLADIRETDEALVVTMDLPGVDKQDVDITITDDELRVVAERKKESEIAEKDFHKRERICTRFERSVTLPVNIKVEETKAKLAEGVLEITLPKEMVTSRKRISIE
jgi:HSP20 family protein